MRWERQTEPPIEFKYSEGIDEDTIVVSKKSDIDDSLVNQIKDNEKKPGNKKLMIAGIVFASLIVLTFFAILILPNILEPSEIIIPDVSGITEEEAIKKLENMGLTVSAKTKEENSEDIEEGLVIATDPKIGRKVKEGTEITLTISKGIEVVEVEDYTGKNYIEIKTKLELKNITVIIEKKDAELIDNDAQLIVDQSIKEGETIKKGDKITLYIPNEVKEYCPDMVNEKWSVSKAQTWAKKLGVNLTIKYQETNDYEPDTIIKQSKESGDEVEKGDTLVITVTKKTAADNTKTETEKPDNQDITKPEED